MKRMEVIPEETEVEEIISNNDTSYLKYPIQEVLKITNITKVHEKQLDKVLNELKISKLERDLELLKHTILRESYIDLFSEFKRLIYKINMNNYHFNKRGVLVHQGGIVIYTFNRTLWIVYRALQTVINFYCDKLGFHVHLNAVNRFQYQVQYSFFSDKRSDNYFVIVAYDYVKRTFDLLDVFPRPAAFKELCEGLAASDEMMFVLCWVRKFFKHHIKAKESLPIINQKDEKSSI